MAAEVFNEEVANLLKRKIKRLAHADRRAEHRVRLRGRGDGGGRPGDSRKIVAAAPTSAGCRRASHGAERADALRLFAANLQKAFYGFEPDFFQQNLIRIVDDVVTVIKGSIELWPTLVEICYFQKDRQGLPGDQGEQPADNAEAGSRSLHGRASDEDRTSRPALRERAAETCTAGPNASSRT